jgi:uncharacterized protein YxeA
MSTTATATTQNKKPKDTPFRQQTLPAWQPILTIHTVIAILSVIGIAFMILGSTFVQLSDSVVELHHKYDGSGADTEDCKITSFNQGKKCTVSVKATAKMKAPIYVYYQIDNFYQNHRQYVKSWSYEQLLGDYTMTSKDDDLSDACSSLLTNGSKVLNPCGLVANSLFNDVITLSSSSAYAPMTHNSIAWKSDVEHKFQQPGHTNGVIECKHSCKKKFIHAEVTAASDKINPCVSGSWGQNVCSNTLCTTYLGSKGWETSDGYCKGFVCPQNSGYANLYGCDAGTYHVYWYPDQDTTQYLYQTFPEVISPLVGVKSPQFAVWMRTAALPKFMKLYGKIETDIPKGATIDFDIVNNFAVNGFKGSKTLVITTTTWIGGKNAFLGRAYLIVGSICLAGGIAFFVKWQVNPRKLGDTSRLY